MKIKEFKKLVKEIVEQEMTVQKEQILKEIKAELFDIMTVQKVPKTETKSEVNESLDRTSLRRMFEEKLGTGEDIYLNTSNVPVPQETLPSTFEGTKLTEDHKEVLDDINKDYSQLMKKMGV